MQKKLLVTLGAIIGVVILSIVGSQLWLGTSANAQVQAGGDVPEVPDAPALAESPIALPMLQQDSIPQPDTVPTIELPDLSNIQIVYLTTGMTFNDPLISENTIFNEIKQPEVVSSMDDVIALEDAGRLDAIVIDSSSTDLVDSLWLINAMRRGTVFAALNVPLEEVARLRGSQCELDTLSQINQEDLWWENDGRDYYYIRSFYLIGASTDDVMMADNYITTNCTPQIGSIVNELSGQVFGGGDALQGPLDPGETFANDLESAITNIRLGQQHAQENGALVGREPLLSLPELQNETD